VRHIGLPLVETLFVKLFRLVGGFAELLLSILAVTEHHAIPLTSIGTFDITLVSAVVLGTLHLAIQS
jgi:hypothetical protein